jgi:hypothetical protein
MNASYNQRAKRYGQVLNEPFQSWIAAAVSAEAVCYLSAAIEPRLRPHPKEGTGTSNRRKRNSQGKRKADMELPDSTLSTSASNPLQGGEQVNDLRKSSRIMTSLLQELFLVLQRCRLLLPDPLVLLTMGVFAGAN